MKLTGGILGWGGERLGGVHGSLVGYVITSYIELLFKLFQAQGSLFTVADGWRRCL